MKIYFFQKPHHRERQKDTVLHLPQTIHATNPSPKKISNLDINKKQKKILQKWITKLVAVLPLINIRYLNEDTDAQLWYTWGIIPLLAKKPYYIELDNPYALTFYNTTAFSLYKPLLKQLLGKNSCKGIIFMTKTARAQFLKEMGDSFASKTHVSYPFMQGHLPKKKKGKTTTFLFVGMDFERKGGKELLEAFKKTKNPHYKLIIIGTKKRHTTDPRIAFLGKVPRKELFTQYYPESDIFVFPTFHESLGVVALEALSYGMPIITTNTYALGELVLHKKNGILLEHPYQKTEKIGPFKIVNSTKYTITEYQHKILDRRVLSEKFIDSLANALEYAATHKKKLSTESIKQFTKHFDSVVWQKNLEEVLR